MSSHTNDHDHEHEYERLLAVRRPTGADDPDPRFVEALRRAEQDPGLAGRVDAQGAFDGEIAGRLQSLAVPPDLRAAILGARRRPAGRWAWTPVWGAGWAAAAAVLVGVGLRLTILHLDHDAAFSRFRRVIVAEAWGGPQHLEFQSGDLAQVRAWLAARGVTANLALPEGLRGMRVHGCEIVEAKGHRVAMVCLAEGTKHLHLLVAEGLRMGDLPAGSAPDFQRLGPVNTAAWRQGDRTYVLAGLKPHAFVTKFRRAGRWILSG